MNTSGFSLPIRNYEGLGSGYSVTGISTRLLEEVRDLQKHVSNLIRENYELRSDLRSRQTEEASTCSCSCQCHGDARDAYVPLVIRESHNPRAMKGSMTTRALARLTPKPAAVAGGFTSRRDREHRGPSMSDVNSVVDDLKQAVERVSSQVSTVSNLPSWSVVGGLNYTGGSNDLGATPDARESRSDQLRYSSMPSLIPSLNVQGPATVPPVVSSLPREVMYSSNGSDQKIEPVSVTSYQASSTNPRDLSGRIAASADLAPTRDKGPRGSILGLPVMQQRELESTSEMLRVEHHQSTQEQVEPREIRSVVAAEASMRDYLLNNTRSESHTVGQLSGGSNIVEPSNILAPSMTVASDAADVSGNGIGQSGSNPSEAPSLAQVFGISRLFT